MKNVIKISHFIVVKIKKISRCYFSQNLRFRALVDWTIRLRSIWEVLWATYRYDARCCPGHDTISAILALSGKKNYTWNNFLDWDKPVRHPSLRIINMELTNKWMSDLLIMYSLTLQFWCSNIYNKSITSSVFGILHIVLYNLSRFNRNGIMSCVGAVQLVSEKQIKNKINTSPDKFVKIIPF